MISEHLTTCRLCPAFCGMKVELDGDTVVAAKGDPLHPISRGYLCPKGRNVGAFHHHPQRLDHAMVDGVRSAWDVTLDDLASRMKAIVARDGAEAIGYYTASGGAYDTAGRASIGTFFRKLGSSQRYSAVTVDCAPGMRAQQIVTGGSAEITPEWFPDDQAPKLAVTIGSNPVVSHAQLGMMLSDPVRWIRDYQALGGELWVVDPRRTETARFADHHMAIRPGSDAHLLAYLCRELLKDGANQSELDHHVAAADLATLRHALGPFDLELAATRTGLEGSQIDDLLAAIRRAGKLVITLGTGLNFTPDALLTQLLRWVILVITGSVDREGGMWVNVGWYDQLEKRERRSVSQAAPEPKTPRSRPDLPMWLGEVPCGAMVDQIENGHLKALFINGGSPLTAFPEPERLRKALRSLELLVVIDVMANELTEIATHVLPAAAMLERSDLPGGWSQHMAYTAQVVPIGADRRKTWWMFAELGRRLGFGVMDGIDPDTSTDDDVLMAIAANGRQPAEDLFAAGPRGIILPRIYGWVHDRVLPGGKWQIAPDALIDRLPDLLKPVERPDSLRLVSGRELHNHNRMAYGRYGHKRFDANDLPTIGIHPEDAARQGVSQGDAVTVKGDRGSLSGTVRIDHSLLRGTLHLTHGALGRNACELVSSEIDPATGQPVMMSAIPVEIALAS
ncbi:anaerobic selenocysteine-containing dehydrogenase [Novosphingobium chloroacetimidivorans]|uniref:Anaerobic selenocysteine-containing dehydrogenase n=1 Tax=Novosphingobium chloroacetimidivorans TaxID=1428314 RepID=A0A7W7KDX5_9SPHN|nr:molybdopterin-dependent oxidoreductase [Novosphingobium chloroacetimidivorans]MBB4860428.1 anaerobic selenocysteine-containing dehydrogenase [Novosphingobium chloroacetimidivorans]